MGINIHVHSTHRQYTNGMKTIRTNGKTVGEALNNFVDQFPGMRNELFTEKGDLLHYIEIYLNKESAYPGELERKVEDGDDIQIAAFLAGG